MVERPVGAAIADAIRNDLVHSMVATDALIGTFARLDDASLLQNVCLPACHLISSSIGDWRVPVGGIGCGRRGAGRRRVR